MDSVSNKAKEKIDFVNEDKNLSSTVEDRKTEQGLKTVYVLRVRPDECSAWGEPEYFRRRKERDRIGSVNRVIGGIRTHSYEEKKTPDEIDLLCDEGY